MATGEAPTREAQREVRKPFATPSFLYFMFSLLCGTLRCNGGARYGTSMGAGAVWPASPDGGVA
jgi:hypothetical protein